MACPSGADSPPRREHDRDLVGLWGAFIGVVAVPDRLVPQAFQSNWLGMGTLTVAVIAVGLCIIYAAVRLSPKPSTSVAQKQPGRARLEDREETK